MSAGKEPLDRLDALQLPLQSDTATRSVDPLRTHPRRLARRLAPRRAALRRCAGAARGTRLRERAPDQAARALAAYLQRRLPARGSTGLVQSCSFTLRPRSIEGIRPSTA